MPSKTIIGFLFGHHWLTIYKGYLRAVDNSELQTVAADKLKKMRVVFMLASFSFWSWIVFVVFGANLNIFQQGSGTATGLKGIGIVFYLTSVFCSYTALLNWQVPKRFVVPDYIGYEGSDETIHFSKFPDPTAESFPIGVSGKDFFRWNFSAPAYAGNICITGEPHLWGKEEMPKALLWGIFGDPDTVVVILDSDQGLDFSWLQYDYRSLLGKSELDDLLGDEQMAELAQLDKLPQVAVKNHNEIGRTLIWIEREIERRLHLRAGNPFHQPFTKLVIVTDEEVTESLIEGKSNGVLIEPLQKILKYGRPLQIYLIAVSPADMTWGGLRGWQPFFSCFAFHHVLTTANKSGQEVAIKQMVEPAYGVFQLYWKGRSRELKMPSIADEELAEWIYLQTIKSPERAKALWQSALQNKPYVEPRQKQSGIKVNMDTTENVAI